MSAPRSIVIANAGSGKTFTLANRIIAWCIEEIRAAREPKPSRILAVTFTRKAAGEILARILANAAEGAADNESGAKARAKFEVVVGPATAAEYQGVLVALCSELHRMQVGTIDGFFHRIASALPDEVGLPPEWTVGDDQDIDELRAQVAAEILADEHAGELINMLEDGAPKPSVLRSIADLLGGSTISVLDIYRATAAAGDEGIKSAWGWIERIPSGAEPKKAEYDDLVELFARLEADIPRTAKGKGPPSKSWVTQHAKLLGLLRQREFRSIAEVGFLASLHAAAGSEAGGSYQRMTVPDSFCDFARRFVPHLRAALLRDIATRMHGALRVLPMADRALRAAQEESGIYSFSDIGRGVSLAAQRAGSRVASASALREALGADIRDLAIDEAQDTSAEQFLAMRPMLQDVLGVPNAASAGRFLLVGDPKQSIYGWRGGTPGLIAEIRQDYAGQLGDGSALTRSFRSSPIVMDFVNRVFGTLERDLIPLVEAEHLADCVGLCDFVKREELPDSATESAFKRAIAQWEFTPHEADKKTLPGRIEAYAFGKPKAEKKRPGNKGASASKDADAKADADAEADASPSPEVEELKSTACAASVAARIHRDFPDRSIGILVRTNREISDIIARLKALGVPASDEGRSTLLDSPAVAGVVALLRLIDDPSDRVSHFLVSRGPLQKFTGLAELESRTPKDSRKAAEVLAQTLRGRLADIGLAALLREVCDALVAAGIGSRDRARLERVIAIAEDFADLPHARTIDFLDAIAADKADSSSSDKVRVMTVHKSKGLEFDEVVLASLDGGWGSAPKGWGMLAIDPKEPPQLVAPLASEAIRAWIPELVVLERDGRRRQLLDDLSALYVAITRARCGLHLLMDINEPGELPTASKLIRAAVSAAAEGSSDTLASAPSIGTAFVGAMPDASVPFWSATFGEQAAASTAQVAAADHATAPDTDPQPLVAIVARHAGSAKSPSTHDSASLWQTDPFTNDDIAVRGVVVHECFREIQTASDYDTDDKRAALLTRAVRRAAVEKGTPIAGDIVDGVRALFARIAAGPIADALRPAAGTRVRTELPFVRATAEGLVHGRIDRLELLERDGRVVGAVIVDFKTGATGASQADLAKKVADYTEQLRGYQDAVAEMYGLEPASIALRLLFVDRGEVVSSG